MAEETTPQDESQEPEGTAVDAPARVLPNDPILAGVAEPFPDVVFTSFQPVVGRTQNTATVPREQLMAFAEAVRDAGFETFIDV